MQMFVDVVLPLPMDQPFTYSVPARFRDVVVSGMRVLVPVRQRMQTGYVTAVHSTSDQEGVKDVTDVPDPYPIFSEEMLQLCRWIADYYCCSWGEALQGAAPAGMRVATKMRYRLLPERLESGRYTKRQQEVVAALYKQGPLTETQLAGTLGRAGLRGALDALVRRGLIEAEPLLRDGGASLKTETYVHLAFERVPPVEELARLQRRAPKQAAVYLDLLHGEPERAASALMEKHGATHATLKELEKKGLITRTERELYRAPDLAHDSKATEKHVLNAEQQAAYDAISASMAAGEFKTYLLHGITGSGKTEVYLQAIESALALGKTAIILVPEISLTPQTVGRFFARFKQDIAVLHSGLSTGERYDEWRRALRGEVRIMVGARSAVFAPLPRLGILIVDEEHDHSYKQGETPRYHARDVAIMRAKLSGAVCVLGSATPSLESYYNTDQGKSALLELSGRATNASLPNVKLVDMRTEAKEVGGEIILSRVLEQAVNQRVADQQQVILLLNRRGYAPYVLCPQCSWVATCEDCQVSLTYHSSGGVLRCHYCGANRPRPEICDACAFKPLVFLGTGTQKAEDYLLRTFAGARIERMDADTTAGKGGHAKILGRFAAGEIDILIGTQMLAKGHDYPGVTLVGVLHADNGLSVPDFRAAENTFQLLTQVAGRAGRGAMPGEVLIQTYRANHYSIVAAATHDFGAFYRHEIENRHSAGYPPFRRMANLLIESEDPVHAERAAIGLHRQTRQHLLEHPSPKIELIGPSPAVIRRIQKKYRWHLALLSPSSRQLNATARAARGFFEASGPPSGVSLKIDLDPYGSF